MLYFLPITFGVHDGTLSGSSNKYGATMWLSNLNCVLVKVFAFVIGTMVLMLLNFDKMKIVQFLDGEPSCNSIRPITEVQAMSPNPNRYVLQTLISNKNGRKRRGIFVAHLAGSEDDPIEVTEDNYVVVPAANNKKLANTNGTADSDIVYEYALVDGRSGDYVPSGIRVATSAKPDPRRVQKFQRLGIKPNLSRGEAALSAMKKGGGRYDKNNDSSIRGADIRSPNTAAGVRNSSQRHLRNKSGSWNSEIEDGVPTDRRLNTMEWTGTKKNLVIPMMFSNHHDGQGNPTRWLPTTSQLDTLFNSDTTHNSLAPTGSVKKVFMDSSYNKLILESTIVDWIPLDYTEAYYANGNRGFTDMMHQAIKHALDKLESNGFDFSPYDTDDDGNIDAICFLHSGYAAEWGGYSEDNVYYLNRIWSHKWFLDSFSHPASSGQLGWTSNPETSSLKAVRVYNYHISPAVYGKYPTNKPLKDKMGRVGVIAHETGHFLGLPDLYDTDYNPSSSRGNGIGSWGLMANSWGFTNDQLYPPALCPWSKIVMGWLSPTEITFSGLYELNPSYTHEEVYKITVGYEEDEYLLLEYRRPEGFDSMIGYPSTLIDGGLAVWHIDSYAGYNTQGWPGQDGWPTNGKHYKISLLQADGLYNLEQNINRGDAGDLFVPGIVDGIGPDGTRNGLIPTSMSYPNTASYRYGNVVDTGIVISDIQFISSSTDDTQMALSIHIPSASPSSAPSEAPSRDPYASTITCTGADRAFLLLIDAPSTTMQWTIDEVSSGETRIVSPFYIEEDESSITSQQKHEYCLPRNSGCYRLTLQDTSLNGFSFYAQYDGEIVVESDGTTPFQTKTGDFGYGCTLDTAGRAVEVFGAVGNTKASGMMFDIEANTNEDVMIYRFTSLHLDVGDHNYKIYTKNGSYRGYETDSSAWMDVTNFDNVIFGSGQGLYTHTSVNIYPMTPILADTVQAFYIVLNNDGLFYTTSNGKNEGDVWKTFNKFTAHAGRACTSSTEFAGCDDGSLVAGFDGRIHAGYVTLSPPLPSSAVTCIGTNEKKLVIEVQTDWNPEETTWEVVDAYNHNLNVAMSAQYTATGLPQYHRQEMCINDSAGCYKFVVKDSMGDGIIGSENGITLTYGGEILMKPRPGYILRDFTEDGVDFGNKCLPIGGAMVDMGKEGLGVSRGVIFDTYALTDMMVRRMAYLHLLDKNEYGYKIYTKNGSYQGYETDSTKWTLIHDTTIVGVGPNAYTKSENFNLSSTIPILAGTTQAFYIVLSESMLMYKEDPLLSEGDVCHNFENEMIVKNGIAIDGVEFATASNTIGTACIDGKITYAPVRVSSA